MAETEEVTLSQIVRAKLASTDETDTAILADQIISELAPEDYEYALSITLPLYVGQVNRSVREQTLRRVALGSAVGASGGAVRSGHDQGASKWERDGSVFHQRVYFGAEYKLLGDCNAHDLAAIAAQYDERAKVNGDRRDKYYQLRDMLIAANVDGIVRDELTERQVAETLTF